ncbi:MAG: hypothetical protein H8E85_02580 [Candidatus Marinimicrobia bacterium]|nr:hypothetical protein [Candidatus Neomarinimicrobiota bacterium]
MNFLTPPFNGRAVHILLLGGLALLLSCQSDPIVFNPSGGYEYNKKSFPLNNETSETIQGELHTGKSSKLYSGILSNGDTVSTLIRLLPEVLDSHQICGSDSIIDVEITLTTINPIAIKEDTTLIDTLIQFNALKTYLISTDVFEEDVVITNDIVNNINGLTIDNSIQNVELNTNSIELNLLLHDSTIIKKWCEDKENLGVVISYAPDDSSYLEFFSSNSSEVGLGPRLNLEYSIEEETSKIYNRYSFNQVSWSEGLFEGESFGPYYVEDSLSSYWGTVYAINSNENMQIIDSPPLVYDSITVQTDFISAGQNSALVTIDLDLNPENIDSISFSILNAFAFKKDDDPAGDNWDNGANIDSTEGDSTYNVGELFNDYGIDNCPDELEDGFGGCASSEEESAFNSKGTEGNGQLDWTDENVNNLWDEGEGEIWWDWGPDWCPDSLENGVGFCIADTSACNCLDTPNVELVYDPNNDNADPTGDDWHEINNLDGTEGNNQWDPGEPFYDWGLDELPMALVGYSDEFEGDSLLNWTDKNNNGTWDQGEGERWFDTGMDGTFNEDEAENYENHTEGNFIFNTGERYLDCGEGENQFNSDLNCVEDSGDNYNIDPNLDNWSATDSTSTGTEGNGFLDEGEEWFDWGLDGIQDSLEAFQVSSVISIERYDNSYIFNLDDEPLQFTPALEADTVSLWISEIQKVDNSIKIEVSVQSNINLKGLQFQLYHTPFTKVDTSLETYTPSIAQLGEDKLFEDFTLLPKKNYSDDELNEQLLIEYSNDLSTFLDFDSLNLFLENEEYIFSHQYSNLVFYIDTTTSDLHEDGMWVYLTHLDDSGEDEILITKKVTSLSDSVEISMGQILRAYQSGSIATYNGLKLKADDNLYNYSKLSIKNNPRIDVMYSQ